MHTPRFSEKTLTAQVERGRAAQLPESVNSLREHYRCNTPKSDSEVLTNAPCRRAHRNLQLAVIVAVGAMGMVQMAVHQVIDVIPVRYCLMAAVGTVNVRLIMSRTFVAWCAFLRIRRAHLNAVVLNVIAVGMVQVAILKIVRVAIVLHGRMATVRAMFVAVSTGMLLVSFRHRLVLSQCGAATFARAGLNSVG